MSYSCKSSRGFPWGMGIFWYSRSERVGTARDQWRSGARQRSLGHSEGVGTARDQWRLGVRQRSLEHSEGVGTGPGPVETGCQTEIPGTLGGGRDGSGTSGYQARGRESWGARRVKSMYSGTHPVGYGLKRGRRSARTSRAYTSTHPRRQEEDRLVLGDVRKWCRYLGKQVGLRRHCGSGKPLTLEHAGAYARGPKSTRRH